MFFPDSSDGSSAVEISLAEGDEKSGMDMQFALLPLAKVSGTVERRAGAGDGYISVRLVPLERAASAADTPPSTSARQPGNTFEFENIRPGEYWLIAEQTIRAGSDSNRVLWNHRRVDVNGDDVADLVLTLEATATVSAKVVVEPKAVDETAVFVSLKPETPRSDVLPLAPVRSRPDGAIRIVNLKPGRYRVTVFRNANLTDPLQVVELRRGGVPLRDDILAVAAGDEITDLDVVVSRIRSR